MKKSKIILISSLLALIAAAVILAQVFTPGILWILTPKAKPQTGVLESVDPSEHITQLEPEEIKYLINNSVTFESDEKKGNFMFENPEVSEYTVKFFVYEKIGDGETENLIYESDFINPGQYISGDKLLRKLKKGTHECSCIARAYKDGEFQGEQSSDITVAVLK